MIVVVKGKVQQKMSETINVVMIISDVGSLLFRALEWTLSSWHDGIWSIHLRRPGERTTISTFSEDETSLNTILPHNCTIIGAGCGFQIQSLDCNSNPQVFDSGIRGVATGPQQGWWQNTSPLLIHNHQHFTNAQTGGLKAMSGRGQMILAVDSGCRSFPIQTVMILYRTGLYYLIVLHAKVEESLSKTLVLALSPIDRLH